MRKQCHPYSTRVLPSHPIPRSFLPPVPRRRASLLLLMLQPPLPGLGRALGLFLSLPVAGIQMPVILETTCP